MAIVLYGPGRTLQRAVLVADPDAHRGQALACALARDDLHVDVVSSAETLLARLLRAPYPDVLVLDTALASPELAEQLWSRHLDGVRVIALADSLETSLGVGFRNGLAGYFVSPDAGVRASMTTLALRIA